MSRFAELFKAVKNNGGRGEGESLTKGGVNQPYEMSDVQDKLDMTDIRFTLLLVDDEENVLNALRRVFLEEDYEILTAASGEKAIKIMEGNAVHLVISDNRMPSMVGSELLREIKNRWPETIRIMLTGHADVQAIMGAVNEGAVYKFILKPWDDDDLRLTVSLALQQYVLIQENKRLRKRTEEQEQKIKNYCAVFNEYRGMLGDILVETGTITRAQLDEALRGKRSGEFISDTIIRLGLATESKIIKAVQKHQNIDYVDIKEIDIDTSIARLFTYEYCVNNRSIPIKLEGKRLTVAMADPSDVTKIDNISVLTGFSTVPVLAASSDIMAQIEKVYGKIGESEKGVEWGEMPINLDPIEEIDVIIDEEEEVNINELTSMSGIPPVVRIVNAVILEALRYHASDIHIEPKAKYTIVRFRIDGMLATKIKVPSSLHAATVSRIKVLAKMDIAEHRKPQDGRINIKVGARIVDLRISIMPTISGEKAVLRILDKSSAIKKISELGVFDEELHKLNIIIKKPQGIIIATGPTGSGKTTMLYSILYEMLEPTKNFETIEDPVEYFLEEANQVYVKDKVGLSFGNVLRATLRQDPDVILVGEIRDTETADVAFKAALTGHMVLTTLHTNNTVASITRLIDIGVKPYLIASAVEGIVAQRLVRKVCKHCKAAAVPDDKILELLKIPGDTMREATVGEGCSRCDNTGYSGRTGIFEFFVMNEEFRHLISSSYKESEILKLAKAGGMRTLMEIGIEKVRAGITTLDELLRVIGPPTWLECKCEQCERSFNVNFSFCPYCGTPRSDICGNCKTSLEEEWQNCPSCGKLREYLPDSDVKTVSLRELQTAIH